MTKKRKRRAAKITMAEFTAQVLRQRRIYCQLRPQILALAPEERRDYQAALEDRAIPIPAIARVLTARGLRVNSTTLQEHRRRLCRYCY